VGAEAVVAVLAVRTEISVTACEAAIGEVGGIAIDRDERRYECIHRELARA
jgi:hypothetical protein